MDRGTDKAGKGLGDARPRLDGRNPRVSPGLADVVHKCLERDARGRYPDAASLATDLRRHNNDLPLRGVANRSPVERWRKWRRRRPRGLLAGVLRLATVVAVAAVVAASVVHYVRLDRQIEHRARPRRRAREGRPVRRSDALPGPRAQASPTTSRPTRAGGRR